MGKVGLVTRGVPKLIDPLPGGRHLIDGIEFIVSWARANSLWPLVYGTACCAMEMMSTGASRHDWARFGVEVARATPRQADLIVLAGTIVEKMSKPLVTLYEQMPGPKYVIAMGSCAISGGPFYYDSYSVIKGGDRLIPVDVYIPGCPPRPEALLYGIMQLQKKIRTEGRRNPWQVKATFNQPIGDPFTETKTAWAEKLKKKPSTNTEHGPPPVPAASPAKPKRLVPPTYPELNRSPAKAIGLSSREILALVHVRFPNIKVAGPDGIGLDTPPAPAPIADLVVPPEDYFALVEFLKANQQLHLDLLQFVTAVDWRDRLDVVSMLISSDLGHKIAVRTPISRTAPALASLTPLYPAAAWHEREVFDFFGVRFSGHPDLRRLFLDDEFPGHPLLKDFRDETRIVPRPY